MVVGPDVARVIEELQDGNQNWRRQTADTCHQDLLLVIKVMGNSFEHESLDVVKLNTNETADSAAVETLMNIKRICQEQFEAFTRVFFGQNKSSRPTHSS